ncbi:T-complex protein 1 subunit epsilon-like [Lathyrus oleraceus]|uniref:T-complex protein 1 subunit epsilon-like n=1 Tax=Pisum sativum TaxID=3888 RepID=UPI0021CF711F|nr:T-complex protein 1 subunit epsilon-like [Pisum sativum]
MNPKSCTSPSTTTSDNFAIVSYDFGNLINQVDEDCEEDAELPEEIARLLNTLNLHRPKPKKTKHKIDIDTVEKFQTLRKQEQKYFDDMVQQCKDVGTTLVICKRGFDGEANHLLMHTNLPAVRLVVGVELELIAIATSGRIVPRFQELTAGKLGKVGIVREKACGTAKDRMLYIEYCANSKAVLLWFLYISRMFLSEGHKHQVVFSLWFCFYLVLIAAQDNTTDPTEVEALKAIKERIATNEFELVRKFGTRNWQLSLYGKIEVHVEQNNWEYSKGNWQYQISSPPAIKWKSINMFTTR